MLSIGYGGGEGLAAVDGVAVPASSSDWFPGQLGPGGRVLNEDGTQWIFPHRHDMGICLKQIRRNGRLYNRGPDPRGTSRSNFFRETFCYRTTGDKEYYGDAQVRTQATTSTMRLPAVFLRGCLWRTGPCEEG